MSKLNRREFMKAAGVMPLVWSGIASRSAYAQSGAYPDQPITLVVPYGAGNSADIIGRLIALNIGNSMGQQVIVENRPGAGGVSGIKQVVGATPDGYTILYMGAGAAISQALFKPQPYDIVQSLEPIATVSSNDVLLIVRKQSPFTKIGDFIQASKKTKGGLMVGISLLGTMQHMCAELFKVRSNADMTIVPFRTATALSAAISAGDIDLAFEFVPPMLSQLRSGQVRALAIANGHRSEILPDVPTLAEQALPGFSVASWGMFVAPAHTPAPIVERLNKEIRLALSKPEVLNRLQALGIRVPVGSTAQARELVTSEVTRWKDVVREAKISLS